MAHDSDSARRLSPRKAALKWANFMRARAGLSPLVDLPRGVPKDEAGCPLALATGLIFDDEPFARSPGGNELIVASLPRPVVEFIREFDRGAHPDLIESPV